MDACGFGAFVPFGEIPPGSLFLDRSPDGAGETAILLKVGAAGARHNVVRLFDRAASARGAQMPALVSAPMSADHHVVALAEYFIEVESSVDNIVWETDAGFVRAVVCADGEGALLIKAFHNRNHDDYECDLFDLATGAYVTLDRPSVGFRRWSVVRRGPFGNREELYRFEA